LNPLSPHLSLEERPLQNTFSVVIIIIIIVTVFVGLHATCPSLVTDFNQTRNVAVNVNETPEYRILSRKFAEQFSRRYMRTGRDRETTALSFASSVEDVPKT
jgi:hypothetical protein